MDSTLIHSMIHGDKLLFILDKERIKRGERKKKKERKRK